ncbi:serine/threonine-protein kinase WNK3-like [Polyodon spathula]|uniref:serine/threonine-protein kinase WNK3-like n=1 Tax=Polyodon spathula TaxID=7913 RepID=UPI001B7D9D4A|nr:serine/threonine-protein kinase WNK3-like [Polyodon spathula]
MDQINTPPPPTLDSSQSSPVGRWRFFINQTIRHRESQSGQGAPMTPAGDSAELQPIDGDSAAAEEGWQTATQPLPGSARLPDPSATTTSVPAAESTVLGILQAGVGGPQTHPATIEGEETTTAPAAPQRSSAEECAPIAEDTLATPEREESELNRGPVHARSATPEPCVQPLVLTALSPQGTPQNQGGTPASHPSPAQPSSVPESDGEGPPKMDFVDNRIKTLDEKLRNLLYPEHSGTGAPASPVVPLTTSEEGPGGEEATAGLETPPDSKPSSSSSSRSSSCSDLAAVGASQGSEVTEVTQLSGGGGAVLQDPAPAEGQAVDLAGPSQPTVNPLPPLCSFSCPLFDRDGPSAVVRTLPVEPAVFAILPHSEASCFRFTHGGTTGQDTRCRPGQPSASQEENAVSKTKGETEVRAIAGALDLV